MAEEDWLPCLPDSGISGLPPLPPPGADVVPVTRGLALPVAFFRGAVAFGERGWSSDAGPAFPPAEKVVEIEAVVVAVEMGSRRPEMMSFERKEDVTRSEFEKRDRGRKKICS